MFLNEKVNFLNNTRAHMVSFTIESERFYLQNKRNKIQID